jgi:carbon-monoxide dehydrogenase large subunit
MTTLSYDSHTSPIGQSLPRAQDERMLRGRSHYVDDLDESGVLHAAILRSPVASGEVVAFDASAARASTGVALALGPDEIAPLVEPVPATWLLPGQQLADMLPAERVVRYVGQPVGIVVATSRAAAEDAAELVDIEYKQRAAVVSVEGARTVDAPLVYPELETNQVGCIHFGEALDELEGVFTQAPHVVERHLTVPRISHSPLEPRGIVAEWVPAIEQLTAVASTQAPHVTRQDLARALRLRVDQVRVVAPDVGGSFGQKTALFPDEALVCLAAKQLGGKVKWIEDRSEALTSSYHGRGTASRSRLAYDRDGNFLALHTDLHGDLGAFTGAGTGGSGPFQVVGLMVEGPYRFEAAGATITGWYTNAPPTCAFRGYGMQEGTWIRERLADEAARELGVDPIELRRKNMLQPDHLPHVTHTQVPYDNGDYPRVLDGAAAIAADTAQPSAGRVRRGVGLAAMVEITGFAPSGLLEMFQIHWSGWEASTIRVNEDGTVTVFSGVTGVGQGIETALTQIAAERLAVPPAWISVQLGDTATASYSNIAAQASRSLPLAGSALWQAADRLRTRMTTLAASALGAPIEDVSFNGTQFQSPAGHSIEWRDVAHRGWMGWGRGDSEKIQLQETVDYDPAGITFGYATHGAQVAVDLDTGKITVENYWVVHDSGIVVNPTIAEGQIYGGVTMGLGGALYEQSTFSPDGQPTATTYLDYIVPLSEDVPDITVEHIVTPSEITPGGFKGLGESGTIPPPATIGNAVAAAVPEIAAELVDMPLSPSRIWTLLDKAGLTH